MLVSILVAGSMALLQKQPVIVIDPGHPSEVGRGTKGKKITEIDAAWQVGLKLRDLLDARGYSVVLTKKSPQNFVTNRARAEVANRVGADLMVRLHCDHAIGESGFASYYADRTGTHAGFVGPSKSVLAQVKRMAKPFHDAARQALHGWLKDRGLRTDRQTAVGARYGALVGSIYGQRPSILVEMCVLSNRKDEAFISSVKGQSQMAKAIAAGIEAAIGAIRKSPRSRI